MKHIYVQDIRRRKSIKKKQDTDARGILESHNNYGMVVYCTVFRVHGNFITGRETSRSLFFKVYKPLLIIQSYKELP